MNARTRLVAQFEFGIRPEFDLDHPPMRTIGHWDNRLTSDRYPLRRDLLGNKFLVDVHMFQEEVRLNDELIQSALADGYTLPGVIGAVLLPNFCTRELRDIATDTPVFCPDTKEFLYKKGGAHRVPYFVRKADYSFSLHVMGMKAKLYVGTYMAFFKEK